MINAAVVGLGQMGAVHAKAALDSPHVGTVYGWDPAAGRAEALGLRPAGSLEEILSRPDIGMVTIASPNEFHAAQAVAALRAGKAVLCEKPMGLGPEDARAILAAERESGAYLQIGFELHDSTLYATAKRWADEGRIGIAVNCHCVYYCSEFHFKDTWRSRSPGTLVGEKLSHYLDLQRWFIGRPVEEVYSLSAPNAVEYFNHPDNHQITLRFQGGAVAQLNFVMHLGESDDGDPLQDLMAKQAEDGHCLRMLLFGTKGAIETDVFRRRLRRWEFSDGPKRLVSRLAETRSFPPAEDLEWVHNVYGQDLRAFERVARGEPPTPTAADSYETMKVVFAAERSGRDARIVRLDEVG